MVIYSLKPRGMKIIPRGYLSSPSPIRWFLDGPLLLSPSSSVMTQAQQHAAAQKAEEDRQAIMLIGKDKGIKYSAGTLNCRFQKHRVMGVFMHSCINIISISIKNINFGVVKVHT